MGRILANKPKNTKSDLLTGGTHGTCRTWGGELSVMWADVDQGFAHRRTFCGN